MNSGKGGRTSKGMENGNEDTRKGGRAIAAASFGCIAPAAYAENATSAVISDDGSHVVVDVDLNGSAPVGDATEQADMKSSQAVRANRFPMRNQTRP